ncbi:uncharacterized protein N7482_002576 [Penicillium canariense]|uniref:Major facilitator superfamily (MFS) profile domain-containing protein n=1 Tax=Penicillium canariense TaxID=189055 RepID=A0A9W9II18_9EURO|nr:uncharacterized protein N7482_002576 [Penicillium canariense]KAJ5176699.1 hypothetical protein N7482_002576 [Penicillium canariense]
MPIHAAMDEFPPGTILLEDRNSPQSEFILSPTPTDDPDDPLNWSSLRKAVNFGLTCSYVLFTFVLIDINTLAYRAYIKELGLTYATFNQASGCSYAGLAVGCLVLIPCVHKYGRRPLYLVSATIQLACALWWANFHHAGELIAISLLSGLAGSISEAVVMITVVDLFFVHQHARMNGIFIFMQSLGATGGPIVAGYIIVSLGWRWMWWMIAILLGVNLLLVLCFFEESKYIPTRVGHSASSKHTQLVESMDKFVTTGETHHDASRVSVDAPRSGKSIRQRLAFITKTDVPILQHFYQPLIVLFAFPAVSFAAITYGSILAWFSANVSAGSYFLIVKPYNFNPSQIGLFHLGGFAGTVIATLTAPALNDWLIVWRARRNEGIFEPEMRLWMMFPAAVFNAAGLMIFGIGLGRGLHWAILAVGNGLFGFGFIVTADVALTYLTDSYPDILGDALIAVVFVRNGFAMIIRFAFTDWIAGMGIENTFILIGAIAFITAVLPALLMVYGKRARVKTTSKYRKFASRQQVQRLVEGMPDPATMSKSSITTTEKTFSSYNQEQGKAYADARPDYHPALYQFVLDQHTSTNGQLGTLLDVGSGPGNVARALGKHFAQAIGLDPSEGMVSTARSLGGTTSTSEPIRFELSTAEDLGTNLSPPIQDASVDLITAGNAAHWFDMPHFWSTAARVLKPGGSVALWTSGRTRIHPSVPNAAAIQDEMDRIEEEYLVPYFVPGNILTRNRYVDLPLPWSLETPIAVFDESASSRKDWEIENDFYTINPEVTLDFFEKITATGSPVVRWRQAHPELIDTERDVLKIFRRAIERLLHEAGVEKGKETVKGATHGCVLIVKKKIILHWASQYEATGRKFHQIILKPHPGINFIRSGTGVTTRCANPTFLHPLSIFHQSPQLGKNIYKDKIVMQSSIPQGQTLVYSTIDGHDVKLDYYLPRAASGRLPAVIYYHGGGMTAGWRRGFGFPTWLYDHCQEKGYVFIAADYRLCHPTTALDQIDDAKALFKFITGDCFQKSLPESIALDGNRIAVTGFSAGAFSARAACVYADPRPAVLMTAYGTSGDWLLDHWTVGRPATTIAKLVDLEQVPKLLADKSVVSEDAPAQGIFNRLALTVRWELDGTFLDGCLGRPGLGAELNKLPYEERAAAIPEDLKPAFLQLFVSADYPPAIFVHGTSDEVVPDQESVHHHEQLKKLGVKTELILVKDAGHGLADLNSGFPPKPAKGKEEAYHRAAKFIDEAFAAVNS